MFFQNFQAVDPFRNPPPTSLFSKCLVQYPTNTSLSSLAYPAEHLRLLLSSSSWSQWFQTVSGWLTESLNNISEHKSPSSAQTPACVIPWKVSKEDTCVFSSLLRSWCWIKVLWGSIAHVEPQKPPVTHYRLQKPAVPKESLRYYHTRTERQWDETSQPMREREKKKREDAW